MKVKFHLENSATLAKFRWILNLEQLLITKLPLRENKKKNRIGVGEENWCGVCRSCKASITRQDAYIYERSEVEGVGWGVVGWFNSVHPQGGLRDTRRYTAATVVLPPPPRTSADDPPTCATTSRRNTAHTPLWTVTPATPGNPVLAK